MKDLKIAIGSDHGGFELKNIITKYLSENQFSFIDCGTNSSESCDYPKIAECVAKTIQTGEAAKGILICGTGIGMSISANKFKGIRAALCSDTFSAKATREHNDSNILCLGQRVIGEGLALEIVKTWLNTDFQGERHQKRIDMIKEQEN